MNEIEKFLPLGSICLFKGTKRKSIIVGYFARTERDSDKICDYMVYPYPVGACDGSKILVFNHKDIEKVYYIGYNDKSQKKFNEKMIGVSKELEKIIEEKKRRKEE